MLNYKDIKIGSIVYLINFDYIKENNRFAIISEFEFDQSINYMRFLFDCGNNYFSFDIGNGDWRWVSDVKLICE